MLSRALIFRCSSTARYLGTNALSIDDHMIKSIEEINNELIGLSVDPLVSSPFGPFDGSHEIKSLSSQSSAVEATNLPFQMPLPPANHNHVIQRVEKMQIPSSPSFSGSSFDKTNTNNIVFNHPSTIAASSQTNLQKIALNSQDVERYVQLSKKYDQVIAAQQQLSQKVENLSDKIDLIINELRKMKK